MESYVFAYIVPVYKSFYKCNHFDLLHAYCYHCWAYECRLLKYEPCHKKTSFLPAKTKPQISCAVTAKLCSNCEAGQCLCFRYTGSAISLLPKSEMSRF